MMTLKEIINEMNLDYMQIVRNGESPSYFAREAGYIQCEQCKMWTGCEGIEITSGMNAHGIDICEDCVANHKNKKYVKAAIETCDREV